jgi:soluble lytic murein transglycosylase-like protein
VLRTGLLIIVLAVSVPVLRAGEDAVLTSGARLHAERHEVDGESIRLYIDAGTVELPASAIDRFEYDEAPLPLSPSPIPLPALFPVSEGPVANTPDGLAQFTARKYSLPPEFVASVMETESAMRPDAVSPKGAIGLMQLMPETARYLGVDPHDPAQNTDGGVRYLRELLARFESSPDQVLLALAAYNAGPEAVARYHGVPPYAETRAYVLRVLKVWERRKSGT